jgi:hypothetical protein
MAAKAVELRVYTAAEADQLKEHKAAFAANRERILAEWSKRYDGKSEPES